MARNKQKNFRSILQEELGRRIKRNALYSMRSYARDLGMSAPLLSCVLRGKVGLSEKTAKLVSEKIKLSSEEQRIFVESVLREKAGKKLARSRPKAGLQFDQISRDQFLLVSEWYHFAILELTYLDDFVPDTKWIAGRLGISVQESEAAVERLQNLKLLRILRSGRYKPTSNWTLASSGVSSDGVKRFHSQILKKSEDALFKQDVEIRHYATGFQAINLSDIPEAKKEIDRFINHFVAKFGRGKAKNAVYSISTQFFRTDSPEV